MAFSGEKTTYILDKMFLNIFIKGLLFVKYK